MKKNTLLLISILAAASLSACATGGNTSSFEYEKPDPEFQAVIDSLKGISHTADVNYDIYYNQNDPDSVDGYLGTASTRTFSYSKEEGRGYKIKSKMTARDLVKGTREFVKDEAGNVIETTYDNGEKLYFCDDETGCIIAEYLGVNNKVETYLQSEYDYEAGTYLPIAFDSEFRNPFDYIQARDLSKVAANTYSLNLDKASFALECYGSSAAMAVKKCTITTNESNQIEEMNFEMNTEGGEGYTYVRDTSLNVKYSKFGKESELAHIKPCENNNPELATALKALNKVSSYKYSKDYINDDGTVADHIVGYITQDAAFYHHHDSPTDTKVYSVGDDYDYLAAICDANNKYYGFEYTYNSMSGNYEPGLIMLSVSAAYSIDDFSGLGPNFKALSSEIFSLKEGTNNVYVIENDTLRTSIASYFDFQYLGVNSQVLETRTDDFELTLDSDGSMTINTGYRYSESGKVVVQKIVFRLDASSFNNTELPSYVEIPDTTGCEKW